MDINNKAKIVILIPCLNEEITIGKVIHDFQDAIPEAKIIILITTVQTAPHQSHESVEQK